MGKKKKDARRSNKGDGPILVAVDFSSHSEAALAWAIEAASRYGRPLVVRPGGHDSGEFPGYMQRHAKVSKRKVKHIEAAARELLDVFIGDFGKKNKALRDIDWSAEVVVGIPGRRIAEYAESIDALQIVVGSHGRTGLMKLLLGSKAAQVLHFAAVPVTIVKRSGKQKATG